MGIYELLVGIVLVERKNYWSGINARGFLFCSFSFFLASVGLRWVMDICNYFHACVSEGMPSVDGVGDARAENKVRVVEKRWDNCLPSWVVTR